MPDKCLRSIAVDSELLLIKIQFTFKILSNIIRIVLDDSKPSNTNS